METFSALLAICVGNSPVPDEFPAQRPVTRSFDVFFDQRPNKRLSKQSWGWWIEMTSCTSWRHHNDYVNHMATGSMTSCDANFLVYLKNLNPILTKLSVVIQWRFGNTWVYSLRKIRHSSSTGHGIDHARVFHWECFNPLGHICVKKWYHIQIHLNIVFMIK